jgi:preprotein translocase subunit YajC
MLFALLSLLADEPAKDQGGGAPAWGMFIWLLPMAVVFYLLVMRPARKQEAQRQALVNALKKNDKVLTTAGIIGTVVSISEKEDEVTVRVDENCRLKMLKSSISRNLTQEEAAKKPEEQKAEAAKS